VSSPQKAEAFKIENSVELKMGRKAMKKLECTEA
jgi:hypothetical protein